MPFTIPNEAQAGNPNQAEIDAKDIDIIIAAHNGTGVISGCATTAQGTPDMTVAVAAGVIVVNDGTPARGTVAGGNVTITAADGTNPRFDLIVSNASGTLSATAGTAAAEPVYPAIPANSVVLATVYVPAGDTAIETNQITDKRVIHAIPVAQLEDGTDGELITWDANGVPATVAAGTVTQVLTSNGAGAAPTFQAAGSGVQNPINANLDISSLKIVGNGGSTGIAISANGEVTMAAQPAFAAFNSGTDTNVTGDATTYTVQFNSEVYDQNADFANPTFTAPITGKYLVTANVEIGGNTGVTVLQLNIVTSNRSWGLYSFHPANVMDSNNNLCVNRIAVVDMDAADTLTITINGSGGSKVQDVLGNSIPQTCISGVLLA